MSRSRDEKRLPAVLIILFAVLLLTLMLNYLRQEISSEGKQLKTARTLELRIVPLLQSHHFNFIQTDNAVYTNNYLYASFSYPWDSDIEMKLRQLNYHLKRYNMEGSYEVDSDNDRIIYRIREGGEQAALFHLTRRAREYTYRMAVILDDFGYNFNETTQGFLAMDMTLNISIIPGHRFSRQIAESAARKGHEVMLHMPMEPFDYMGGEDALILRPGMRIPEVSKRIRAAMNSVPNAAAMNNHMGSKATSDRALMHALANSLLKEDILFVDSYTYAGSVVDEVFASYRLPSLKRDIFLDNENEVPAIRRQIRKAMDMARRHGQVIAIGHDRPATLQALKEMKKEFEKEGIELVRITSLRQ